MRPLDNGRTRIILRGILHSTFRRPQGNLAGIFMRLGKVPDWIVVAPGLAGMIVTLVALGYSTSGDAGTSLAINLVAIPLMLVGGFWMRVAR